MVNNFVPRKLQVSIVPSHDIDGRNMATSDRPEPGRKPLGRPLGGFLDEDGSSSPQSSPSYPDRRELFRVGDKRPQEESTLARFNLLEWDRLAGNPGRDRRIDSQGRRANTNEAYNVGLQPRRKSRRVATADDGA